MKARTAPRLEEKRPAKALEGASAPGASMTNRLRMTNVSCHVRIVRYLACGCQPTKASLHDAS